MGRKKKADTTKNVCVHCQKEFHVPMRWCGRCEDHMGTDGFLLGKDTCDRCFSGDNDEYLERKKGREQRIAAALEKAKDPKNWCDCGAVEAFEKWVNSEEYKHRFDPTWQPKQPAPAPAKVETAWEDEEQELRTHEDAFGFIPGF